MTDLDELRGVPLLAGLTDEQLERVRDEGVERVVRAGELNGREGEPVEHLYVILSGDLRVTKKTPDGGEVVIMEYLVHQRRLLPLIARSYALQFAQNELVAKCHELQSTEHPDAEETAR